MRNRSSCASGRRYVPGLLDRVLRRDHHERPAHRVRDAVDRDLPLLHDLEQSRLGLRRRAVDLVGEDDRGEDRARVELEPVRALVVDRDARDVGRQQVRRELDPVVAALHRRGERLGQRRLAGAGRVLEQQVTLGDHRGEREPDRVLLAEQRQADVGHERVERLREPDALLGGHRGLLLRCRGARPLGCRWVMVRRPCRSRRPLGPAPRTLLGVTVTVTVSPGDGRRQADVVEVAARPSCPPVVSQPWLAAVDRPAHAVAVHVDAAVVRGRRPDRGHARRGGRVVRRDRQVLDDARGAGPTTRPSTSSPAAEPSAVLAVTVAVTRAPVNGRRQPETSTVAVRPAERPRRAVAAVAGQRPRVGHRAAAAVVDVGATVDRDRGRPAAVAVAGHRDRHGGRAPAAWSAVAVAGAAPAAATRRRSPCAPGSVYGSPAGRGSRTCTTDRLPTSSSPPSGSRTT